MKEAGEMTVREIERRIKRETRRLSTLARRIDDIKAEQRATVKAIAFWEQCLATWQDGKRSESEGRIGRTIPGKSRRRPIPAETQGEKS